MSDQTIVFAEDIETGKPIETTVKKLILNRALIEGDSGSGKSHDVTTFVERTDKLAQRIIIDIEGEYFPLKDNFPFLLIGKANDIIKPNLDLNLNDVYVDKLAKKLIEKSADTIIDLSETPTQAPHFVAVFFPALLRYAKLLKRPLLVIVDEAHVYAPEKGTGSEESLKAMIEMAKRGRKRGIGLICATQAMADFSKNVVRQLKIRFIGNCTYDKDIKSACDYLGFGKDREDELKNLAEDHHFFVAATGNAVTIDGQRPKKVLKVKFLKNKTKLYDFDFGKSFKINEKYAGTIRDIAAGFSDIPQQIDQELSEKELLKKENIDLKKKTNELTVRLSQLERQPQVQKIDPQALQKAEQLGYQKGIKEAESKFTLFQSGLKRLYATHKPIYKRIAEMAAELEKVEQIIPEIDHFLNTPLSLKLPALPTETKSPTLPIRNSAQNTVHTAAPQVITKIPEATNRLQTDYTNGKLTSAQRKILTAIVQRPGHRGTRNQIAVVAGYEPSGGHFKNMLGGLRSAGFIEYENEDLIATQLGVETLGDYEPLPTDSESIQRFWLSKLPSTQARILQVACKIYPNQISREDLAIEAGFTGSGGHFKNTLGSLHTTGLIDYLGNDVKASKELFPMEVMT